jgi:hypothetical protein
MRRPAVVSLVVLAALVGGWFAVDAWRRSNAAAATSTAPSFVTAADPPPATERHEVAPRGASSADPALVPRSAPARAPARSNFAELNNRGIVALEAGELETAIEHFETCYDGDRSEPIFARNLAEALTRKAVRDHELVRPCAECVETLARAFELAPSRAELGVLLERWRRELETESEFHRVQSQHFELAYEVWREGLLDSTADLLEALELHYAELAAIFGVRPAEQGRPRIPVSLYRPKEFSRITGLAEWAGASYDGVIRAPVAEDRSIGAALDELLRHELIHAFVREAGGRDVPGWLNEGLAQWLQRAPGAEVERARTAVAGEAPIELSRLQGALTGLPDTKTVALAYAQSLAFCAWIDQSYGRAVLLAMVAGCARGEAADATFESWTRVSLAEAFEHFRRGL